MYLVTYQTRCSDTIWLNGLRSDNLQLLEPAGRRMNRPWGKIDADSEMIEMMHITLISPSNHHDAAAHLMNEHYIAAMGESLVEEAAIPR